MNFDSQDLNKQVIEDAQWAVGKEVDIVVPAGRLGVKRKSPLPSRVSRGLCAAAWGPQPQGTELP